MAIRKEGIIGSFSGKVGGIVGYQLNGQNIIRSLPTVIKRKPTALTLLNRERMKAVSQFLRPLKRVIDFGYKNVAPKGSRVGTFQLAQSYTFKNAIDYGENNMPYVNPEKLMIFRGDLMPPPRFEVIREGDTLHFTWDKDLCTTMRAVLLVLAYVPEEGMFWFEEGGAKAMQGLYTCDTFRGTSISKFPSIHLYAGFYDIRRDELSNSVYAGCV